MSQSPTPRVFVSAVSSDLAAARNVVSDALNQIECLPIEQSKLGTEYGPVRDMLERKIADCQAVIHLVGRDYGGEPDPNTVPDGQPLRSWTQIEHDLAVELDKKLYIVVCDADFPFATSDEPESLEKTDLQARHRQAVVEGEHLWHTVKDLDELRQRVVELKLPMDELRAQLSAIEGQVDQTGRRLGRWAVAVAVLLLVAIGIGGVKRGGRWNQSFRKPTGCSVPLRASRRRWRNSIASTAKKADPPSGFYRSMSRSPRVSTSCLARRGPWTR